MPYFPPSAAGSITNYQTDAFSGTGAQTIFTLAGSPGSVNNTFVNVNGVSQLRSSYTVVGTTLTFSQAPPTGTSNIDVSYGTAATIGTPGAGTVTANELASLSVSTAKIQALAVTKDKLAALGQQLSASSGTFTLASSSTLTDVTNLTVTITTTGRPVVLLLISDSTVNTSFIQAVNGTVNPRASIQFIRASTTISDQGLTNGFIGATSLITVPPSSFQHIDIISAGTYTYKIAVKGLSTTDTTNVYYTKLLAYEL